MKRLGLVLVVLAALGVSGWIVTRRQVTPYRGFQNDEIFVDLPAGTHEAEIARRLSDAGVVVDPWTFRLAARLARADRRLKAGEYRFAEAATPGQIVSRLVRGDVFTRVLTFPEGLTIRDMAPIFERSGLGSADDFMRAASNGALAAAFDPGATSLEGYLFPSTYALPRRTGAQGTIRTMVTQFDRVFDARLRTAADARHLTIRDAVTIASIVEKETAQADERPIVAAVYYNRLARHMPLQCDPTVIYALMLAGTWNGNITRQDLQIDSPYNTYRYAGLPPGPIASPGRSALEAALHPADVPYLYFVSRNDGTHVFATSLEEHDRNVRQWQLHHHTR